ncbi:MAG: hypothetical protein AMS18_07165, partial [Gemmatimonas sp. SG8_17]
MRVLLTGAAGFIGGHMCRAMLDQGFEVLGIDNFDPFYDRSIKEETIRELSTDSRFSFAEVDIRDDSALSGMLAHVDIIVHLAARAGVRPSIDEPALYASVNVGGTVSLLEACRAAGVQRLV